tara:strand:- start:1870 stop:2100 length:231 start_codon:yes stop_codon:yes gene_type:complete
MINSDLSQFPNKSGWAVVHDSQKMTYVIRNDKGQERGGSFTQRRWGEQALHKYLQEMKDTAPKNMTAKAKEKVHGN